MKLLFCRSNTPISWLIRLVTWSSWSHVVVVGPDGVQTLEATWPRVTLSTVDQVRHDNGVVLAVEFPCPDPETAWAWGLTQQGKPYDLLGIIGLLFHESWANEQRWWCSDYATALLLHGGRRLFRPGALHRIDPEHLWLVEP